jgi:hypothetical protein
MGIIEANRSLYALNRSRFRTDFTEVDRWLHAKCFLFTTTVGSKLEERNILYCGFKINLCKNIQPIFRSLSTLPLGYYYNRGLEINLLTRITVLIKYAAFVSR